MMRTAPRTGEAAVNLELARQLRCRHPRWEVQAEKTQIVSGEPALRPDIVITKTGGQPIILETEFHPATTVEQDAISRLGRTVTGQVVEGILAVRMPVDLSTTQERLHVVIADADFSWCLIHGQADMPLRWPEEGWLQGGVDALTA